MKLHEGISRGLSGELEKISPGLPPELGSYYEDYRAEVDVPLQVSSWKTLLRTAVQSHIVYVGDFHTLPESQLGSIEIARKILAHRRRLALAVEMVPHRYQDALDLFLQGKLDEPEFLRRIRYDRSWGFQWDAYRDILRFARKHRIPVRGINGDFRNRRQHLARRDRFAARIIGDMVLEHPDRLLIVLCGELHVAKKHLPAKVDKVLEELGVARRSLIVFQNGDPVFNKLMEQGLEQRVRVVSLGPGKFCVLNSPPVLKLHSYLHWQQALLSGDRDHGRFADEVDYAQWVEDLARHLARFFGLLPIRVEPFTLYTAEEAELEDWLRAGFDFAEEDLAEVRAAAGLGLSRFFERSHLVYLASPAINHLAELASSILRHSACGCVYDGPPSFRDDFYYRVIRGCLAFLAARILHPYARAHTPAFFRSFLKRNRGQRLTERGRTLRRVGQLLLSHERWRQRALAGRPAPRLRFVDELPVDLKLEITRALGESLGAQMYQGLLEGEVDRKEIRDLYRRRLGRLDEGERFYLELAGRFLK